MAREDAEALELIKRLPLWERSAEARRIAHAGGGTRTPDTRIMIPHPFVPARSCPGRFAQRVIRALPDFVFCPVGVHRRAVDHAQEVGVLHVTLSDRAHVLVLLEAKRLALEAGA